MNILEDKAILFNVQWLKVWHQSKFFNNICFFISIWELSKMYSKTNNKTKYYNTTRKKLEETSLFKQSKEKQKQTMTKMSI